MLEEYLPCCLSGYILSGRQQHVESRESDDVFTSKLESDLNLGTISKNRQYRKRMDSSKSLLSSSSTLSTSVDDQISESNNSKYHFPEFTSR